MRRIQLGELSVTNLALGGVNFNPSFPVAEVISAYLELGGNLIDTAHCYGFWDRYGAGASERSIADFVRGNREGIIVTTKGGHPSAPGYRTTSAYLSPERIRADIDDSLARLECDYIDLYWLHRDDEAVAVDEIVDLLNEEVALGRIRELGASNWSTARIAEANAYAERSGQKGFVASQVELNLAAHPPEPNGMRFLWRAEEIAWHTRTQFPLLAYSAAAHGYFAGSGATRYESVESARRRERARELAGKYGLTPQQIAIAYVANQPFPAVPIVGTRSVAHLREAVEAADTAIEAEDIRWLSGSAV